MPFRLKIALLSSLISAVVLVGFGSASWYVLYRQRIESLDTEIRALGSRHPGWLANRNSYDRFESSLAFIFGEQHRNEIILLVKDATGAVLYTSPGWPTGLDPESIDCSLRDDPLATNSPAATAETGPPWAGRGTGGPGRGLGRGLGMGRGGQPVIFNKTPRFLTVPTTDSTWRLGIMGNDNLRIVVGLNCDSVRAEMNRMRNVILMILPAALLLVGGGGWWIAGRALRPLRTIARTAERMTAQALDQRIPVSREDPEIARLIQVLNGMMNRLETSFRQATRFSADASHELKTPLAVMQGELENALQSAVPGSTEQQVFTNLLEETQRLKTITRGLLLLAHADAGQMKLSLERLDLSKELEAMIEDARILATEARLDFDLEIPPRVCVMGDRGLLNSALLNLLHNAIKYNQPGGRVQLKLGVEGDKVSLEVGNTGPGIPEAETGRVFERFYRGDATHHGEVDGFGLGLSLAREIARAHHGDLRLRDTRTDWTCFVLTVQSCPASSDGDGQIS